MFRQSSILYYPPRDPRTTLEERAINTCTCQTHLHHSFVSPVRLTPYQYRYMILIVRFLTPLPSFVLRRGSRQTQTSRFVFAQQQGLRQDRPNGSRSSSDCCSRRAAPLRHFWSCAWPWWPSRFVCSEPASWRVSATCVSPAPFICE